MNILQQARGLRIGGFVDVYEEEIAVGLEHAADVIMRHFGDLPPSMIGRAYDGAFVFQRSKWREIAVYWQPGILRFEDRIWFPVWVRVLPSDFPKEIQRLTRELNGEQGAPSNGG